MVVKELEVSVQPLFSFVNHPKVLVTSELCRYQILYEQNSEEDWKGI
jgi:hypothetical protein